MIKIDSDWQKNYIFKYLFRYVYRLHCQYYQANPIFHTLVIGLDQDGHFTGFSVNFWILPFARLLDNFDVTFINPPFVSINDAFDECRVRNKIYSPKHFCNSFSDSITVIVLENFQANSLLNYFPYGDWKLKND